MTDTVLRPSLTHHRILAAPVEPVFCAWSEPAEAARWFAPSPDAAIEAEFDLRAGGAYRIRMGTKEAVDRNVEVDPPRTLAFMLGLGAALAQADPFLERAAVSDMRGSALMGATVYVTETSETQLVVDVGGFLGFGARTVMVEMDALQVVHQRDSDAVFVLLSTTREALENAPEFDAESISSLARTDYAGRSGVPETRVAGYEIVLAADLTADDVTGAVVYDRFGDRVTGISSVVLSSDGDAVASVVVDVGGFLGLFSHSVEVGVDQLEIHRDTEGDAVRVYLDLSQEELEALLVHEG